MKANVSTVNLADGRVVTLSYGVAVAAFVPADWPGFATGNFDQSAYRGFVKTDRAYGSTSNRHANLYARQNGSTARAIPHAVFRELVAPIATEG